MFVGFGVMSWWSDDSEGVLDVFGVVHDGESGFDDSSCRETSAERRVGVDVEGETFVVGESHGDVRSVGG